MLLNKKDQFYWMPLLTAIIASYCILIAKYHCHRSCHRHNHNGICYHDFHGDHRLFQELYHNGNYTWNTTFIFHVNFNCARKHFLPASYMILNVFFFFWGPGRFFYVENWRFCYCSIVPYTTVYLYEVKPISSQAFNPWKTFGVFQSVITKKSVSAVFITSVFGLLLNQALNNIRECSSLCEHFQRSLCCFSHIFIFNVKVKTPIPSRSINLKTLINAETCIIFPRSN